MNRPDDRGCREDKFPVEEGSAIDSGRSREAIAFSIICGLSSCMLSKNFNQAGTDLKLEILPMLRRDRISAHISLSLPREYRKGCQKPCSHNKSFACKRPMATRCALIWRFSHISRVARALMIVIHRLIRWRVMSVVAGLPLVRRLVGLGAMIKIEPTVAFLCGC